jgi:DNA-binding NtrC family response regulator
MVPEIDPAAFNRIKDYPWPGNVRELENAVERELIRCQAEQKQTLCFSDYVTDTPVSKTKSSLPDPITADTNQPSPALLEDAIRQHITATLERTGGKIQGDDGAAKLLGLHPSTLRHKLRKLDIAFGRKV